MTSNVLHAEQHAAAGAGDPQFDHSINPRVLVGMAALMALLLVAFFIYGQMAPGA